jgi:hypothetical protein
LIAEGSVFGRYTVIRLDHIKEYEISRHYYYLCRCKCGTERLVSAAHLKRGKILSCGCYARERVALDKISRGMDPSPKGPSKRFSPNMKSRPLKILYQKWRGMIERCYDTESDSYHNYGGRGIRVCEDWKDNNWLFYKWAYESGYEVGLTIERNDVNGDYCPENCCWIPFQDQMRNMRQSRWVTAFGETKLIADWARDERCAVAKRTLYKRIDAGWSIEDAITKPKTK